MKPVISAPAAVVMANDAMRLCVAPSTVVKSPTTYSVEPSGEAVMARPWPFSRWLKEVIRLPVVMS